jgi:hypothetical protein
LATCFSLFRRQLVHPSACRQALARTGHRISQQGRGFAQQAQHGIVFDQDGQFHPVSHHLRLQLDLADAGQQPGDSQAPARPAANSLVVPRWGRPGGNRCMARASALVCKLSMLNSFSDPLAPLSGGGIAFDALIHTRRRFCRAH